MKEQRLYSGYGLPLNPTFSPGAGALALIFGLMMIILAFRLHGLPDRLEMLA